MERLELAVAGLTACRDYAGLTRRRAVPGYLRTGDHAMHHRTAITVGLGRELWLLTLVVMSCGVSGRAVDANRPAAASARVPAVCTATGQRPGRPDVRRPAII